MRNRRIAILAIVIVAIVGAAAWLFLTPDDDADPATAEASADGDTALVSGRIFDSSGRPLAGANVFAGPAATRADDDGYFSFTDLTAQMTPIDATADGFMRAGFDDLGRPTVDLTDGEPVDDLELFLPQAATATGRIVAGSTPVQGAEISLSYIYAEGLDGDALDPFIVSDVARSDGDGQFEISELAPGRLQILVDTDEYEFTESDEIYFRPGHRRTDLVIDVAPAGVLSGTVLNDDGDPQPAYITLIPDHPGHSTQRIRSDDDGRFVLDHLDTGTYSVHAEADDRRPDRITDLSIEADEITEVELVLESSRGIYGKVIQPDGTPIYRARVEIRSADGEQGKRLQTDHSGRFEWADAPHENWLVSAASPGHDTAEPVRAEHDEEVLIELARGGSIAGQVLDPNGQPLRSFHVGIANVDLHGEHATPFHSSRLPDHDIRDPQGQFEIGPLQSGLYQLAITADGYPQKLSDGIRVAPGQTSGPITIQLEQRSSISGVIRDADTDEPIAGVTVRLLLSTSDNRPPTAQTNADGRYELQSVPSGRRSLRVQHNRYIHEIFSGLNVPEGDHLDYDIELEPVGDGPAGRRLQGIGASLRPADGRDGFEVVHTQDDSPAALSGLRSGDVITGVDDRSLEGMTVNQVVEYIRGEPGTTVTLDVYRAGRGTRSVDVERDRVEMPDRRRVRSRD